MKIFIVGGTGLLGSAAAEEFIKRGHQVKSVALPPLPNEKCTPAGMEIMLGNYMEMTDEELKSQLSGCDAFVFAAGVDERVEFQAPVINQYIKYNVDPIKRLLGLCLQAGIKKAVILGSYFSHFAKIWPEMKLTEHHPYIRSRIMQEETALSFNRDGLEVMILELPYIFGTQPGRKPVWAFLVKIIREMKGFTLFTDGGTTMVTVHQVAQAITGAIEKGVGGSCYPVGWYNMTWKEMLSVFHKYMGLQGRKVITIPKFLFKLNSLNIMKDYKKRGIESGLEMVKFAEIQTAKLFIDKSIIRDKLGVTEDDIDAAIGDSVKLCLEILDNKVETVEMKAE